jgi:hypothetical protein
MRRMLLAMMLLMSPSMVIADVKTRSCTDEEEACKIRCSTNYGYKGKNLANCTNIACAASWRQCMKTGSWYISRTGQTIEPLRKE